MASLGILAYFIRRWISEGVAHHFQLLLEKNKAVVDLEKRKSVMLLERRADVYPEFLELAYRLRNGFRHIVSVSKNWRDGVPGGDLVEIGDLKERVYELTDNLYRSRAFIDEDAFGDLHSYKRAFQDVVVLLNRVTRPDLQSGRSPEEERSYRESIAVLAEEYAKVDRLYAVIVPKLKRHVESVLET